MKHLISIILSFIICQYTPLIGQEVEKDFELWLKTGADFEFSEKFKMAIEEQIRFDENASEVKNYHTEIELKYKFNDYFDVRFVPRFVRRNDNQGSNQGYENLFRYQVGLGIRHNFQQFRLKHRVLFQNRNEMGVSEEEGDIPRQYFRWRTAVEYKIKDWKYDPIFRTEYFYASNAAKAGTDDSIRFSIGTERDYEVLGEFGVFYQIERRISEIDPRIDHILALKYTYIFN